MIAWMGNQWRWQKVWAVSLHWWGYERYYSGLRRQPEAETGTATGIFFFWKGVLL